MNNNFMEFKNNTIYSTDDLIRVYQRFDQGHFFDKDTMRFFSSRITSHCQSKDGALFFITSERKGFSDYTRVYTLRKARVKNDQIEIDTVGDFGEFETMYRAKKALKEILEA